MFEDVRGKELTAKSKSSLLSYKLISNLLFITEILVSKKVASVEILFCNVGIRVGGYI